MCTANSGAVFTWGKSSDLMHLNIHFISIFSVRIIKHFFSAKTNIFKVTLRL